MHLLVDSHRPWVAVMPSPPLMGKELPFWTENIERQRRQWVGVGFKWVRRNSAVARRTILEILDFLQLLLELGSRWAVHVFGPGGLKETNNPLLQFL